MKRLAIVFVSCTLVPALAHAAPVLFDFNNGPVHATLPLDLTVGGITAHFSATGQGFSIQDTQQVIGVLPTGFSGYGLMPNSVFPADLLVSFPQQTITDISIMVAPQELNTDSTATMRLTAYSNGVKVGSTTSQGSAPYFWPSSTLQFSSPQGFDSVVIHYDSPPPTGGDYGPIFFADNMTVTAAAAAAIPEPSTLCLLGLVSLGLLAGAIRRTA